jgi:hypothetical protein
LIGGAAQPSSRLSNLALRLENPRRFERQHDVIRIAIVHLRREGSAVESLAANLCHHPSRPFRFAAAMTSRRRRSFDLGLFESMSKSVASSREVADFYVD